MLFMPTLEDDVAFGPLNAGLDESEVFRRVEEALSAVGMLEKRKKPAHHLSTGEKRRASLAAVLASSPEVVLFDEPTSGLDPRARREFIELVERLDVTVVIATHDLALAERVTDRTLVMHRGKITAEGESSRILRDAALMEENGLVALE